MTTPCVDNLFVLNELNIVRNLEIFVGILSQYSSFPLELAIIIEVCAQLMTNKKPFEEWRRLRIILERKRSRRPWIPLWWILRFFHYPNGRMTSAQARASIGPVPIPQWLRFGIHGGYLKCNYGRSSNLKSTDNKVSLAGLSINLLSSGLGDFRVFFCDSE